MTPNKPIRTNRRHLFRGQNSESSDTGFAAGVGCRRWSVILFRFQNHAMRVFIVTVLSTIFILGCQHKRTDGNVNLERWHSSDVPLKERADAAFRLVPKGTKQIDAERILGEPTRRERFHGPIIYAPGYEGPTNATYSDIWSDFYDFAGGDYVCLTFDIEASRSKWEDRPLLGVSSGNTNHDVVTIPADKK